MKDLDPQVEALLTAIEEGEIPSLHSMSYEDARKFYTMSSQRVAGDGPSNVISTDRSITGEGITLPIRIYQPDNHKDENMPCLIYYHGGGWCIGDLDSHDHICRWLSAGSHCVVIAADYRLAPEHKFPAAVEDALAVYNWVIEHSSELNIDGKRIAVGGDSAGGNLSAVLCLLLREQKVRAPCCQVLIYPATNMLMEHPSHATLGDGYRLTRSAIAWFLTGYLRDGNDMYDFRASPLFAENHSNLPPALILTAGFDPLVDEGEAYAQVLSEAGNAVEYFCYEGMIHGFIAMPGIIDMARTALDHVSDFLDRSFKA